MQQTQAVAANPGNIHTYCHQLNENIQNLKSNLDQLATALNPVLNFSTPVKNACVADAGIEGSGLAKALYKLASDVDDMTTMCINIRNAVDL